MPYTRYTHEEVEARGEAIYAERIRDTIGVGNRGRFLAIDIETGEYEIDQDDLAATKRLLARKPKAIVYGLRIGYSAAYRLGGHVEVSDQG